MAYIHYGKFTDCEENEISVFRPKSQDKIWILTTPKEFDYETSPFLNKDQAKDLISALQKFIDDKS